MKIPLGAARIIRRLNQQGFEAVVVGGWVRDFLMGRTPGDLDIATAATPEQVIAAFKGFPVVPTGLKHGTVTVITDGCPYEVTTYRIDGGYTDGRRPDTVTFTPNLYEDLKRRDFTVNALAYSEGTGLADYFGGAADIEHRVIRCVGNAPERFGEDYLRMLRAYRFAAVLGFEIEESTLAAIRANKRRVTDVSAERIRAEFDKLLLSGNFPMIEMFLADFAPIILPAAKPCLTTLRKTEAALNQRLAALFHNAENPDAATLSTLRSLKYDNKTIAETRAVTQSRLFDFSPEKPTMKRLLNKFGATLTPHCIAYFRANSGDDTAAEACLKTVAEIHKNNEPYAIAHLAVNGGDLITAGIPPGKKIGETLSALLEKVINEPSLNTREALLRLI